MELSDLANLISSRRSIRRWQKREVPVELLKRAVEIATWAPNGGNRQTWRFYVIVNPAILKTIADAVQATDNRIAKWPEAKEFGLKPGTNPIFIHDAPAAIAVATARFQSPIDRVLAARERLDPEAARIRQWRQTANSSVQSAASATAYLLLVLHEMGLGAVWMTGPIQAKAEIEKALGMPSGMDVIAYIPVGYPGETKTGDRRPVTEVCEVFVR